MAFKIKYSQDISKLSQGLLQMQTKMAAMILMYAATKASELEAKMKINRPWTDRTGMAKATLNASVSQPDTNTVRITLAHGVDYGIWLELAHGKNYAIISPTIDAEAPKIVSDLQGLMDRIG